MAELNDDLEGLDSEIEGYLIQDADEVALKTRLWEQMNKDYLEDQADKEAARAAETERGAPTGERRSQKSKRQRQEAAEARLPATAAEAVAGELRRNKLSSRINYEVVQILSQTFDEDMEHMPTGPGGLACLAHMASPAPSLQRHSLRGDRSPHAASNTGSLAGSNAATSDRRDYSENLSIASGSDVANSDYLY